MSSRKDSAMEQKVLKVKKYDVEARRVRTCDDILADARAHKDPSSRRFEIIMLNGERMFFASNDEMRKACGKYRTRIAFTRDNEFDRSFCMWVITLENGKLLPYYNFDSAIKRAKQTDAAFIRFLPEGNILTRRDVKFWYK